MGAVPWPGERADAICARVALRKCPMFQQFRGAVGVEDLKQEGLLAARMAWPKFNPSKAAWSTFVYVVAARRLITLHRQLTRRAARDAAAAVQDFVVADGPAVLAEAAMDPDYERPDGLMGSDGADDTVEDWLGRVYRYANRRLKPRVSKTRPTWFTPAQAIAIGLYMRRMKLSTRGTATLLAEREDLRQILQLRHPPSRFWLWQARYMTQNLKNLGGE